MTALNHSSPNLLTDVTAAIRGVLQNPDLELTAATTLDEIPGWDSMDLIAVIVDLECRYDLLFEPPEIESFYAVGDLVMAIAARNSLAA
jgi:acyl carrier protein